MKFIKRLFRRAVIGAGHSGQSLEAARNIVEAFAVFLETSAPLPGRVADVDQLPHDKEAIKEAFSICIAGTSDPVLIEHLRHGYLLLSAWQENVGDQVLGLDYHGLDLSGDPMEIAEVIQRESEQMEPWNMLIEVEQATLTSELKTMGAYGTNTGYGTPSLTTAVRPAVLH
jgi:hypothetical protein